MFLRMQYWAALLLAVFGITDLSPCYSPGSCPPLYQAPLKLPFTNISNYRLNQSFTPFTPHVPPRTSPFSISFIPSQGWPLLCLSQHLLYMNYPPKPSLQGPFDKNFLEGSLPTMAHPWMYSTYSLTLESYLFLGLEGPFCSTIRSGWWDGNMLVDVEASESGGAHGTGWPPL